MRIWALVLLTFWLGGVRSAVAQTASPLPRAPATTAPPQQPVLTAASDLPGILGKRVVGVDVILEGNAWNDTAPRVVRAIRLGEPFSPAVARRALEEVLENGTLARGNVSVEPDGDGVRVVVRVAPRRLIARVALEAHGAKLDRRELLEVSDLSEGGDIVGTDIDVAKARIANYFALHGYPAAAVRISTHPADGRGRVIVSVDVEAGPPREIDERRFYVVDASPGEVMPLADTYDVQRKARADETALDAADANLQDRLQGSGWFRAHVTHDLVRVDAPHEPSRVWLRVRIEAGSRVVPRFEGNDHYDNNALAGALGLDSETDRATAHLCDKLRAFYIKRGFLDVEVRAEIRGRDTDPVQELLFHITEHVRVRVAARRYPCLSVDAIRNLSSGGPRSPDDIGKEIDSYLDEELPGADLLIDPDPVGLSETMGTGARVTGARSRPIVLSPDTTYVAETYERAAEHIQELYRNEGFLHALVGPPALVRAACALRSPPGQCLVTAPKRATPLDVCTYDAAGLPLATDTIARSQGCEPDPSRGIACSPTVEVVLPIKLGPRTQLWDIAFTGVRHVGEMDVGQAANLALGAPVSTTHIEDARRRIVAWYKELGYAYVDVKYALEPSLDGTRARVRFDVVEGDRVIVEAIEIHGLERTHEGIVRRRVALREGEPYRTSDVLRTRERIATLGVFSSVSVGLADPYVQQAKKTVVIDVVESASQYVELRPGFSTGEGIRGVVEYGHRNILGLAWGITVHVQASYLPDFLILDPGFAANYNAYVHGISRIATRDTLTFTWPEVGLGPTVRGQIDGIFVNDIERDFTLLKGAAIGAVIWRPMKEFQVTTGPSLERNDVQLFSGQSIATEIAANPTNLGLQQLLRVPDGDSNVVAGRVIVAWDRRDSPFNAHSGTYVALGTEQVNSYPVKGSASPDLQYESHFFRLSQTVAGYFPITRTIAVAAELRLGEIVNSANCKTPFNTGPSAGPSPSPPPAYCTYPDRSFYMGGFDSMRGWLQDSFIPQEYADEIAKGTITCTSQSNCPGVPLRGGNFMVNPRLELRFPVFAPIDAAVFGDFGNLWNDPKYVVESRFTLRADVGAGVRVQTPVGPLVLDYGINITRRPYEDFGAFHFAIGLF
jgi:outer membrane protein assembly factor BamA